MANPNIPPGPGRPAGVPNKATSQFKQMLNQLLEDLSPDIQGWLKQIAAEDKSKAIGHIERLAEYCHPKLGRTVHVGGSDDDAPIRLLTNSDADIISRYNAVTNPEKPTK